MERSRFPRHVDLSPVKFFSNGDNGAIMTIYVHNHITVSCILTSCHSISYVHITPCLSKQLKGVRVILAVNKVFFARNYGKKECMEDIIIQVVGS